MPSTGVEQIPVPGEIRSIIEFHDTLFLGGHFFTSPDSTTPAYDVVYSLNGEWHALGVFNNWSVRSLRVLDDTLYAVGSFNEVDGQPCTGMVRLLNGAWQPLPPIPEPDFFGDVISDIVKYDGKLIASGNIYIGDQDGIAYLDGDEWHILGPGLEAGFSSIRKLLIFQNDLYVCGQIAVTPDNPGRDIMRWDGTEFHQLGTIGLQHDLGDDSGFNTVGCMIEHDGLLYVGGGFRYAGGIPALGMATWDGTEWCSVPGNLSDGPGHNGATGGAFLADTLFVTCSLMADGDSVNYAAKFIGESYAGPCAPALSVEVDGIEPDLTFYPNPATSYISFGRSLFRYEHVRITDTLGRVVVQLSGEVTELDVSMWPRGIYMVHFATRPPARFVLH